MTTRQIRGLTIIEVLTTVAITAILMTATVQALATGLSFDQRFRTSGESENQRKAFENDVRALLARAYLNPVSTDDGSFFIASQGALSGGEATEQPDTLTFTAVGLPIAAGSKSSATTGNEVSGFEQLNEQFGPQGGVAELCITPSPIGSAPTQEGLYLRKQVPADGDPTQGGMESQLSTQAASLQFQFFDGQAWQGTWDTRQQATKRLPACVQVTYRWGDEEVDRTFVVVLPSSDVTPENPVTEGEAL